MKCRVFSYIVLAGLLAACGSDTIDEPDKPTPNDPTKPSDIVANWTVYYEENSWQNPRWQNLVNNSAECLDWKDIHSTNLIAHDSHDANHERWQWVVNYPMTEESDVVNHIERFIKWTVMPKSDYDGLSGMDVFSATLRGDDRDFSIQYTYNPNYPISTTSEWAIGFSEYRFIFNGDNLDIPDGYSDWVNKHQKYLVSSLEGANNISYKWEMKVSSLTDEIIDNSILPFIHFRKNGDPASQSYSRFEVMVTQCNSGVSKTYECN